MNVIIYKQENGVLSIILPTEESVALYGIEAVAVKDVPSGRPYKIIDAVQIPTDRSMRDAWTVDDADLTDGVGGVSNEFN